MKKLKIGLFGGVFDPIHNGHLFLAEYFRNTFKLDQIIFLPAGDINHKNCPIASRKDRYAMVRLVEKDNEDFAVNAVDFKRKGPTYTIDSVKAMKKLYGKEAIFRYLIGADNIKDLRNWKNYKTLLRSIKFLAISRPGVPGGGYRVGSQSIKTIKAPSLNISSTQVRKLIKEGNTAARYMIPEKVWKYIQKKGLYL
jgi:nicotinate-nucleotide adenylyltransferase